MKQAWKARDKSGGSRSASNFRIPASKRKYDTEEVNTIVARALEQHAKKNKKEDSDAEMNEFSKLNIREDSDDESIQSA